MEQGPGGVPPSPCQRRATNWLNIAAPVGHYGNPTKPGRFAQRIRQGATGPYGLGGGGQPVAQESHADRLALNDAVPVRPDRQFGNRR